MKPIMNMTMTSPLGLLSLMANETHLLNIQFLNQSYKNPSSHSKKSTILLNVKKQLQEYFAKKRTTFDLPLYIQGTPFQQKVWSALLQIPYGETISYQQQAMSIGNPLAVRAVGQANGKNPFPIIIPCHRVIGKNKHLTGYTSGLNIKHFLLKHEGLKNFRH
jgi:methylated-DNA-[protein]-cysteine S-methyltransferase